MDTQTQIDRLIELAIIQRSELKQLVEQLPQLREHLNSEVEKVFDETEPQLRAELEEWTTKQTADKTAALGVALEAKIADLAKSLEVSTQARYNAIIAEREENARLAAQAEAKIAEHAASLPSAVKDIVTAELARFPRAGEIDQLRKEFAEPRGLNPRGKWQAGESYNKLDLVTINGDSYTSNTDGNRTRPSRSSADWTLVAARGTGGGGGPTSLSELTTVPSDGDVLIGSGTSWVTSNLTAGAGISITVGPGAITISATDGDITLDDGTAASPSLHFTNDPDTGIYRPAANTLGISTSGVQRMYVDESGITTVGAGGTFDGSVHAANGNANNPSFSFTSDQDTGFFRHQPNEIGIALGGTQYATLTSTTFSITPVVTMASSLRVNGTTDSSSKDTGAIVTEGGLGVEKSATIGGNLTVSGSIATGYQLYSTTGISYPGVPPADGFFRTYASTTLGMVWQGQGSTNDLTMVNKAGGTVLSVPTGTTNTTLAGNLTVNGTGTSSFSGILSEKTAAMTNPVLIGEMADSTTVGVVSFSNSRTSSAMLGIAGTTTDLFLAVPSTGTFQFRNGWTEQMRLFANGNLFVGASPTDGGQKLQVSGGTKFSDATAEDQFNFYNTATTPTYSSLLRLRQVNTSADPASTYLIYADVQNGGSAGVKFTVNENGRLQLATHTTSAGGIGFGTDVSLYRESSVKLTANSTGSSLTLALAVGGTQKAIIASDGTTAYLGATAAGGSTILYSGNAATALTLDSSQNATFAGKLTVSGSAASTIEGTLGLNCTPVTWYDNANLGTALQIGAGAGIYAFNTTGNTQLRLYNNAYLDNGGAEKYLTTGEAFVFEALGGEFRWKYASSGTAGNAVTLGRVMSLLGNGNLIVGSGSVDGGQKLQVSGTAAISNLLTAAGASISGSNAPSSGASVEINYGQIANSGRLFVYDRTNSVFKDLSTEGAALYFKTGSVGTTTALTIDSSQNATFAGDVTVNGGNMGIGVSADSANAIRIASTVSQDGGNNGVGVRVNPTFTSAVTSGGYGIYSLVTTAASAFSMSDAYAFNAASPTIGSGSSIGTVRGVNVENMGKTGVTAAYGIDIAAQSGASSINIGLRNLGATVLATPASAVTLATNSTMTFELTSNTSLTIKVRGTDGTTRSVALTLA